MESKNATPRQTVNGSEPAPIRLGIVVGTTRPGRKAGAVAQWVRNATAASSHVRSGRLEARMLDLAAFGLPLLDEPVAAAFGQYQQPHTVAWSAAIEELDAFVFVTPEYNHSIPAALKNAVDFLFAEWNHKPAGVVSYGLSGGVLAAEHLSGILLEVQAVPVSPRVTLSVFDDFTYADPTDPLSPFELTPREHKATGILELLEQILAYSDALGSLRAPGADISTASAESIV